jgi:oligopeptide/dipeptide ABC transporter ATP-binding protein
VIAKPLHPYTKALVSVIPVPEAGAMADQILLTGETPSPTSIPPGCRFAPRCWLRRERGDPDECITADPELHPPAEGIAPPEGDTAAHVAACHFA